MWNVKTRKNLNSVHKEPFYGYSDVSLPYPYPTRSSATAERPHDAPCPLKSLQQLHSCTRNHIWKAYSRNDIGGDSRSSELPLLDRSYVTSYKSYVVTLTTTLSGTVSEILPQLQCTWLDGCDLEKSSIFEQIVAITSHVRFPIHV